MQNNLLSIFKAITPDNIKDIPLIDDSMRIFIELLKENSPISSDIKIALSEETTDSIAEELPKIYLYDYFNMLENLKNNKVINSKFKAWNEALRPNLYPIGLPYIGKSLYINYFTIGEPGGVLTNDSDNVENNINFFPFSDKLNILQNNMLQNKAENYFVNRLFKESKGLKKGVQFIYDILNEHLVNADERLELDFQETGNPFEFKISGSIDRDVYRESVAYLSHPLGFTYDYTYISELKFEDNYSLIKTYIINNLEVRCLSGNIEEYNKEVISIIEKENYIKITFKDNFYLLQENDSVKYYDNLDNLIKIYPAEQHCSIFLDYDIIYKSAVTDEINFINEKNMSTNFSELSDNINFTEAMKFKNKFLIGLSIIGEDLISNDSDLVEIVKYKDPFDFYYSSDIEDLSQGDESFNVADISEDFSIEII
jgi:hypothetical protein